MTHGRLDLRLVPGALAAAAAAALVVVVPATDSLALAALAIGTALVVGAVAAPVGRPSSKAATATTATAARGGVAGQVVLVLLVVAAVLLAGAVQVLARERGGLGRLADERASVRLAGTVVGDPRPVGGGQPGAAVRYRVLIAATAVHARGADTRVAAPVVVLGGAGWSDVAYGSRVVVAGRLAAARPGDRAVAQLAASSDALVAAEPPALLVGAAGVRAGLVGIAASLPGDAGHLLPGVAVGDTSGVPRDLSDAMRASGLTHLTAVSGAHFALVGATVLACAGAVGVPRRARVAVVAVALAGFVVLVRPGPSVLRAAAMGALGVGGLLLGRPSRALSALATGVVVLLVADPWLVREVGFLLSVVATVGLVLVAAPLAARWTDRIGAPAAYALAVPVAAQCACAPIIVLLEPAVATYAVPANVLVAPAVAPATVLGLLAALVAPWWAGGATVLAELAGAACWWIGRVARTAAALPGAQLAWPAGPRGAVLLAVGTLAALILALTQRRDVAGTPADDGRLAGHDDGRLAGHGGERARARRGFVAGWARAPHDAITEPRELAERFDPTVGHRPGLERGDARARRARLRRRGPPG